jgi:N utilization substance protein B
MLNRRTLRIKAMQTVFAFRQSRQANYGIAVQHIEETFRPDLNSMEIQDPVALKDQQREALQLFRAHYKDDGYACTSATADRINEVVTETIHEYHEQNRKDFRFFKKNMVSEVDRIYDRYLSVLLLLRAFIERAEEDTKRDHSNLLANPFLKEIRENEQLDVTVIRKNIQWEASLIRDWFKGIIRKDPEYITYSGKTDPDKEDHLNYVNHLVKDIIFKNEVIETWLEEHDLNWTEDKSIVKSLATKTVKVFAENGQIELQDISYNWEDDKEFFQDLFVQTAEVEAKYEALIGGKTQNWDIERIALTDRIALEMAIAEMINFPSIPVKVTINEYIELVKKYSTPKSKQFINGVLDVIADELLHEGVIKKSGRGLIDNK